MLHNGPPHTSNDAYAYAKRMLEVQSKAYQEQYGENFICIIPTNIYGDYDNYSIESGHVIPALIHKCYIAKQQGKPFVVCGSGKPLRQFIYSLDLAKLIMWSLLEYNEKESIILSNSEEDEVSIEDIARLIAREFDYEQHMIFDTSFSDGQFKKTADNSKLMKLYPEMKFTDIHIGIKNSVQWFQDNYDVCRK
jgi:GDP-L-fucose synthase